MKSVTVHEAKTHLSRLLKRVEEGEEIEIRRGSEPVARLVAATRKTPKRRFGALKGEIVVDESFFDPLPDDEIEGWEGRRP